MALAPLTWADTHRAPQRAGLHVSHSSEDAGWTSLFASLQAGQRYEVTFPAVKHHLLVIPVASKVAIMGNIGGLPTHHTLLPGSITLIPGGFAGTTRIVSSGKTHSSMHLYLRQELLETIREDMFGNSGGALEPVIGRVDPLLRGLAAEIRDLLLQPHSLTGAYVETLTQMLGSWLLRKYVPRQPVAKPAPRLSAQQVARVIAYIETHLDHDLSLTSLAALLQVSVTRLSAGFKARTGSTPYQFILRSRVDKAVELLGNSSLGMSEIALACGFCDQPHMVNVVQRLTGLTPGTIRRSH